MDGRIGGDEAPGSPDSPIRPVLEPAAYHGLPGEVMRTIEPHTEADPAALLLHFLAMFGSAVGGGPHLRAGTSPQPPRLFVVIVGETARGRKGTAGDEVERLMRAAEPEWAERCLVNGARSAEAIIAEVDDDFSRDRRYLIFETEFGRLLATMTRREGMSSVLKDAYDGKTLRIRTKSERGWRTATRPHISLIGHITPGELADRMPEVELTSGFANRILYCASARSKRLTHGDGRNEAAFEDLAAKVHAAVEVAHERAFVGHDPISTFFYRYFNVQPEVPLPWTSAGLVRWEQLYDGPLDQQSPGVIGEVLARAPVNVLRLATTYALADRSFQVDAAHVDAAYAVWRYCEASVRSIFSTLTGSRDVDRVLRQLVQRDDRTLSRTEISEVFNRHRSVPQLDRICEQLLNTGWVTHRRESSSPSHRVDLYTLTEEGVLLVRGESANRANLSS